MVKRKTFEEFVKEMKKQLQQISVKRKGHPCAQLGFLSLLLHCLMAGASKKNFLYPKDREKNLHSILNEEYFIDYGKFTILVQNMIEEETVDSADDFKKEMNTLFDEENRTVSAIRIPFEADVAMLQSLIDWCESKADDLNSWEKLAVAGCDQILGQYKAGFLRCAVVDALFDELNRQGQLLEKQEAVRVN